MGPGRAAGGGFGGGGRGAAGPAGGGGRARGPGLSMVAAVLKWLRPNNLLFFFP